MADDDSKPTATTINTADPAPCHRARGKGALSRAEPRILRAPPFATGAARIEDDRIADAAPADADTAHRAARVGEAMRLLGNPTTPDELTAAIRMVGPAVEATGWVVMKRADGSSWLMDSKSSASIGDEGAQ